MVDDPSEARYWSGAELPSRPVVVRDRMERRVAVMLAVRRFMLLAPIVALCIQSATFALVAASYLSDVGVPSRVGVPAVFAASIVGAMVLAWVWVRVFRMNEADREAVRTLDPYQKDRLTPKEQQVLALVVRGLQGDDASLERILAACRRGRF